MKGLVLQKFHSLRAAVNRAGMIILLVWERMYFMKKTNFFYHLSIVLGVCAFMSCGNEGDRNNSGAQGYDSTATNQDSTNAAHHVDPSNAYPQPPVTGSNQDSSRTKDSANRPGY
jgi:hypothetical protein